LDPITRSAKAMSRLYRWVRSARLAGLALLYMLLANWTSGNLLRQGRRLCFFWLPSGVRAGRAAVGGNQNTGPAVWSASLAAVSAEG